MKYDTLVDYIQTLLQTPDYGLKLKFYDNKGNITLDSNELKWIYLVNNNILIELMDDDVEVINIWKDINNSHHDINEIIARIRKQAILNGVDVKLNNYNEKDRNQIFSLIKDAISKSENKGKEEENTPMNETLVKTYYQILNNVKNARKPSDALITEGLRTSRLIKLLNEANQEICSLNCFKDTDIKAFNTGMFLCKNKTEMTDYVNKADKELLNKIYENVSLFKNVGKFVKARYENCEIVPTITEGALKFYKNFKLFKKELIESDKMAIAYNELKPLLSECTCATDVIRVLKNNKVCENHNITKKDFIDYWLNVSASKLQEENKITEFMIESFDGHYVKLPHIDNLGIRLFLEGYDKYGKLDKEQEAKILKECEIYNNLTDFTAKYPSTEYSKIAAKLLLESSYLLHESFDNFMKHYREIKPSEKYTKLLEAKLRTNHPTLMYISEELAEHENQDIVILSEGLKPYVSSKYLDKVVMNIIDNKLNLGNQLNESRLSFRNKLENMYTALCENLNSKTNLAVSSSIFNILHSPVKVSEKNLEYIKTLIKYRK